MAFDGEEPNHTERRARFDLESPLPASSATAVPAADVTAPPINAGSIVHQAFPLRQPEEEANEILIRVRGTTLRRVRKRLTLLVNAEFPWSEVLLGVSTLLLGASLGAITSSMPWAALDNGAAVANPLAVLFYVVFPAVGAATAVGYFCLRHTSERSAASIAKDSLDDLPDPDRTREVAP